MCKNWIISHTVLFQQPQSALLQNILLLPDDLYLAFFSACVFLCFVSLEEDEDEDKVEEDGVLFLLFSARKNITKLKTFAVFHRNFTFIAG